jgi:hypothetical protein
MNRISIKMFYNLETNKGVFVYVNAAGILDYCATLERGLFRKLLGTENLSSYKKHIYSVSHLQNILIVITYSHRFDLTFYFFFRDHGKLLVG